VELAIAIGFCLGGLVRNDCLAVDAGLGPGERLALVPTPASPRMLGGVPEI